MALNRPLIPYQWAQFALPADIQDPDTYQPTDPNYPNPKTPQFPTGWLVNPGQKVKQPHEWINYWYNGVDRGLTAHYEVTNLWGAGISYPVGAVTQSGTATYIASAISTDVPPTVGMTTPWVPTQFGGGSAANALAGFAAFSAKINNHAAATNNPHMETSESVGGYSKTQIDNAVATINNAAQAHIGRTNNPHAVDYADLGALGAIPGGTFTGQVGMLRMTVPGMSVEYTAMQLKLVVGANSTGLQSGEVLKDDQALVHDNNFLPINLKTNPRFVVPTPEIQLPLAIDINLMGTDVVTTTEYTSVAPVSYTDKAGVASTAPINTPAFSREGLVIQAAAGPQLVLSGPNIGMPMTAVATVDGVRTKSTTSVFNNQNVLTYFNATSTIKDICIWYGTLTPEQLATLGVYWWDIDPVVNEYYFNKWAAAVESACALGFSEVTNGV